MLVQIPAGFVLIQGPDSLKWRMLFHLIKEIRKDFLIHSSFLIPNYSDDNPAKGASFHATGGCLIEAAPGVFS